MTLDKKRQSWWLMEKANRSAKFGSPTQRCHLVPVGQVNAVKSPDGAVRYTGLKTCRSAWCCPICTPRKAAEKAEVVGRMAEAILNTPVMITYTLQHGREDSLIDLLDTLYSAVRIARNGKRLAAYKEVCLGYIGSTEITWSRSNGWHPHRHEMNFLNRGKAIEDLKTGVVEKYVSAIEKSGRIVNEFTVDVKQWHGDLGYITKGSEIAAELTQGMHKTYEKSMNVFDILAKTRGRGNPNEWDNLYLEYQSATHLRKLTTISRSLNRWRRPIEEKVKADMKREKSYDEVLGTIKPSEWFSMCKVPMVRFEVLVKLAGGTG